MHYDSPPQSEILRKIYTQNTCVSLCEIKRQLPPFFSDELGKKFISYILVKFTR